MYVTLWQELGKWCSGALASFHCGRYVMAGVGYMMFRRLGKFSLWFSMLSIALQIRMQATKNTNCQGYYIQTWARRREGRRQVGCIICVSLFFRVFVFRLRFFLCLAQWFSSVFSYCLVTEHLIVNLCRMSCFSLARHVYFSADCYVFMQSSFLFLIGPHIHLYFCMCKVIVIL